MNAGFSVESVQTVIDSWQDRTNMDYEYMWGTFRAHIQAATISPSTPLSVLVQNFLQQVFEGGVTAGYVSNIRSCISVTLELCLGYRLTQDAWSSRLAKGQVNIRPDSPRYSETFDVDMLVRRVMSFGDNYDMPPQQLQAKVVILLRIALLARSCDLAQVIYSESHVSRPHGLKVVLGRLKPDSTVQIHRDIPLIPYYDEYPTACVASAVEAYMLRTKPRRATMLSNRIPEAKMRRKDPVFKDRLLLGEDKTAFPIGAQRIAKISVMTMEDAGIDVKVFKAASIRMASANLNLDAGEDISDVMFRGRWKSVSVFKKFYERQQRKIQLPHSVMAQMAGQRPS